MTRKTEDVLKGLELVIKAVEPEEVFIAIEDNKKAAVFAFQKLLKKNQSRLLAEVKVVLLETKYPQGGEKQLIKAISGKEVPPGKLPFEVGFLVQNVGTLCAIYEAVYYGKPLIERTITVSGDCLARPGNFKVKVGTTVKDIIEKFNVGIEKEPVKIVVGGPMMGFSQVSDETPILKNTSGILFLSEDPACETEEQPCVRCAKCVDVCPMRLSPTQMMKHVKNDVFDSLEDRLYISDCMECGSCSYTCPSRIPLVQYIKVGKREMMERGRK